MCTDCSWCIKRVCGGLSLHTKLGRGLGPSLRLLYKRGARSTHLYTTVLFGRGRRPGEAKTFSWGPRSQRRRCVGDTPRSSPSQVDVPFDCDFIDSRHSRRAPLMILIGFVPNTCRSIGSAIAMALTLRCLLVSSNHSRHEATFHENPGQAICIQYRLPRGSSLPVQEPGVAFQRAVELG